MGADGDHITAPMGGVVSSAGGVMEHIEQEIRAGRPCFDVWIRWKDVVPGLHLEDVLRVKATIEREKSRMTHRRWWE